MLLGPLCVLQSQFRLDDFEITAWVNVALDVDDLCVVEGACKETRLDHT